MLDTVVIGAVTTAETFFYAVDGVTPLVLTGGATYAITTPANQLIANGIALQDNSNAARWYVSFTIPASAPVTQPNQKYTIRWQGTVGSGATAQVNVNTEYFQVINPASPDPIDTTSVVMLGSPFSANLVTPDSSLSTLSLRILNPMGTAVVTLSNLIGGGASLPGPITPAQAGSNYVYSVPINSDYGLNSIILRNDGSGLTCYFAYFNYTSAAGQQLTEIQPVYVANTLVVNIMNDIRQFVDMLRNNDAITELRITEAKLLHFAVQGLQRVNASSPVNFSFDFVSLASAPGFYFWVTKAAQYEILSALYLAEGMTAFDYQGMTVQLNMDRTQYIQSLMNDIKNDLDNVMPKVKSQFARAGGFGRRIGTIGTVLGPSFNWVFRASSGSVNWGGPLPVLPFLI